jgi:hypothetical protein
LISKALAGAGHLEKEEKNRLDGRDYSKDFQSLDGVCAVTPIHRCGVRSDARMKTLVRTCRMRDDMMMEGTGLNPCSKQLVLAAGIISSQISEKTVTSG